MRVFGGLFEVNAFPRCANGLPSPRIGRGAGGEGETSQSGALRRLPHGKRSFDFAQEDGKDDGRGSEMGDVARKFC
jgi:hypothetical protein